MVTCRMLWLLLLPFRAILALLRSHQDLALENLVLRHQLQVVLRNNPRPRLRNSDRIFWVWLHHLWPGGWRDHLLLVRPETVIGWHRRGWRLYWTWRSRSRRGRLRIRPEVRELIATMSRDNRLWGTERIRGELLKLGIVVSNRSIRRYRWRGRDRQSNGQSWRTFLTNQLQGIWAADLFVVQTIGFKTLYVLFFIRHGRRELVHVNVTASPTAAWIWRQLLEATPWGRQPSHLIHDRDAVYGRGIDARLATLGITGVRTPFRSPLANAVGERVVRSFRAECLDHIIVINERHLRAVLAEFVRYYNHERPHRTLALETPVPRSAIHAGRVVPRPILGGLHHAYSRAA